MASIMPEVVSHFACGRQRRILLKSKADRILANDSGVQIIQIERGYELRYFPQFLQIPQADAWLSGLLAEIRFQTEQLKLFGKQLSLKRQTAQYGANYDYNSAAQEAPPWFNRLRKLKFLVQLASGKRFEAALCDLYSDGEAYVGWHQDAGHPEVIASVSVGAVRELRLARVGLSRCVFSMELAHGSLLLIPGAVNERFQHMIPKNNQVTDPRINVTFRRFAQQNGILRGTAQSVPEMQMPS